MLSKKRPGNFIKKESLAQVFSCEFCEIFKNTFLLQNTTERLLLRVQQVYQSINGKFKKNLAIFIDVPREEYVTRE